MNVFSANDLQGTDLLALARPGDDGAPPAVTPPLASGGQGRHAVRLAGAGRVTASRAAVIAAAPGRARHDEGEAEQEQTAGRGIYAGRARNPESEPSGLRT